mgnify:CR=1 FL=1
MMRIVSLTLILLAGASCFAQTYAERLGWKKDDRVLLLHMDDAGMSFDSNAGVIRVLEEGVAPSLSVMMPCPWVPHIVHYMKEHTAVDAGLHLTLTSEWKEYRWGPLSGKPAVPGLVDDEGALWRSVQGVVQHATPDEVDREIRAQLDRAVKMGFNPTHLDSHMGTLFASPEFLLRYVRLGMEKQIPVMLPGGHATYLLADRNSGVSKQTAEAVRQLGAKLWAAGLPVLDDLHNASYDWKVPAGMGRTDGELQKWRTALYKETLAKLTPGVTMVIMHCTSPSEVFGKISDSGDIRRADMLAMVDPELRAFLKREGFILTTWKELHERRKKVRE